MDHNSHTRTHQLQSTWNSPLRLERDRFIYKYIYIFYFLDLLFSPLESTHIIIVRVCVSVCVGIVATEFWRENAPCYGDTYSLPLLIVHHLLCRSNGTIKTLIISQSRRVFSKQPAKTSPPPPKKKVKTSADESLVKSRSRYNISPRNRYTRRSNRGMRGRDTEGPSIATIFCRKLLFYLLRINHTIFFHSSKVYLFNRLFTIRAPEEF